MNRRISIWSGILLCLISGSVFSANSLDVLDRERDRSQSRQAPLSLPKVQVTEDGELSGLAPSAEFTLGSLVISGNTVYSSEALLKPYQDLFGKKITFWQLKQISAELTRKYREAGYMLSRVMIPVQEVNETNANIKLVAVEGYISHIEYTGDERIRERFKNKFLRSAKNIVGVKPLKHADFEREILLAEDLPGIKVSSRFKQGDQTGATVLVLDVQAELIEGSLNWGNTSTNASGPGIGTVQLQFNTLPFIGSQTTVAYSQATDKKEYSSWQVIESYQMDNGLKLKASYARGDSPDMDTRFARLFDYEVDSHTYTVGVSYPFVRSRDMNLIAGMEYEHRDSDSMLLKDHYTRDRLRSLNANINFDFSDALGGVTQINPKLSRGLKAFHATDMDFDASNPAAPADYWKLDVYMSRDQQLVNNFSLFSAVELQLASNSLSSYNRFSLGGSAFGRGYDPGIVEGDSGFAVMIEPRYTWYVTDKSALQFFAFADWGTVWSKRVSPDIDESAETASAGFGVRWWGNLEDVWVKTYSLSAYVGKPLRSAGEDSGHSPRGIIEAALYF